MRQLRLFATAAILTALSLTPAAHADTYTGTYTLQGASIDGFTIDGTITVQLPTNGSLGFATLLGGALTVEDPALANNILDLNYSLAAPTLPGLARLGLQSPDHGLNILELYIFLIPDAGGDLTVCESSCYVIIQNGVAVGLSSTMDGTPSGQSIFFGLSPVELGPGYAELVPTTPEPSSLALLGTGVLATLGAIRRFRRQ